MIFVAVLKNLLCDTPIRFPSMDLSRQTWLATLVLAILILIFTLTDYLYSEYRLLLGADIFDGESSYLSPLGLVWIYGGLIVYWVVDAAIVAASYILFAIIVDYGEIKIGLAIKIARRHFMGFLGLTLLFGAAITGFENIYVETLRFLDVDFQQPISSAPTRDAVLKSVRASLIWVPMDILHSLLPPIVIGLVYKALRPHLFGASAKNRHSWAADKVN